MRKVFLAKRNRKKEEKKARMTAVVVKQDPNT